MGGCWKGQWFKQVPQVPGLQSPLQWSQIQLPACDILLYVSPIFSLSLLHFKYIVNKGQESPKIIAAEPTAIISKHPRGINNAISVLRFYKPNVFRSLKLFFGKRIMWWQVVKSDLNYIFTWLILRALSIKSLFCPSSAVYPHFILLSLHSRSSGTIHIEHRKTSMWIFKNAKSWPSLYCQ